MVCCPIPLHFYNPDVRGPLIIVIPVTLLKLLLIFNKMGQMTLYLWCSKLTITSVKRKEKNQQQCLLGDSSSDHHT